MSTAESYNFISVEDYLDGELSSEVRHEYVGGVVYAMTGGTNRHADISVNCLARLRNQLSGNPCKAYSSDTKIHLNIRGQDRYYYPDVSVTCEPNSGADTFQDKPLLIIEVLSPSTRRLDDGEKRDAYFTLPSLRYYILLEQSSVGAIVYRRDGNEWNRAVYTDVNTVLSFIEFDAELSLQDAYADVDF